MSILVFIAIFSFFVWATRNTLFWVNLWQIKEYRRDRFFAHFTETNQGKNLLFSPMLILKTAVMLMFFVVVVNDVFLGFYQVVVTGIYLCELYLVGKEIVQRKLKRPVLTFKTIVISSLTLGCIFFLVTFPVVDWFLWLLVLDKILFFLILFFVAAFSVPTEFYQDFIIGRAAEKMRKYKNVLVIGITGSYGKSSTKEYVAQILSQKFTVLKTKGTNNTAIGVAQTILSGLSEKTKIAIIEMGAYKKGEISQICKITPPKIGIITGISEQHLSLFGSLEKTMEAKYELIEALPRSGMAVFNGNNSYVQKLYDQCEKRKTLYYAQKEDTKKRGADNTIIATHIAMKKQSTAFDVHFKMRSFRVETTLIGEHVVENILPGILLGYNLGMTREEIQDAVCGLAPLPKTMVRQKLENGVTVIDDSFNASPDAVLAASSYMKLYKGKRILVMQPMIELGKKAKKEHYELSKKLAKICNYIFLTNDNFYKEIMQGIHDANRQCIVEIAETKDIVLFLQENSQKDMVVVFEGKEAGNVLGKFLSVQ